MPKSRIEEFFIKHFPHTYHTWFIKEYNLLACLIFASISAIILPLMIIALSHPEVLPIFIGTPRYYKLVIATVSLPFIYLYGLMLTETIKSRDKRKCPIHNDTIIVVSRIRNIINGNGAEARCKGMSKHIGLTMTQGAMIIGALILTIVGIGYAISYDWDKQKQAIKDFSVPKPLTPKIYVLTDSDVTLNCFRGVLYFDDQHSTLSSAVYNRDGTLVQCWASPTKQ